MWPRIVAIAVGMGFLGFLVVVQPLYWLCLRRPSERGRRMVHHLNAWCARWVLLWPHRLSISGQAHLPKGPVIYVANHRSYLDIPLCHALLPGPFTILGKAELQRVPLFGWMYARQHILLERERTQSGARAMVAADQRLRAGEPLIIYPEGTTRHGAEVLAPFKVGAFLLAHRRRVAVVPIVLRGTAGALPPVGPLRCTPSRLSAQVLPPVSPHGFDTPEALATHVESLMRDALLQRPVEPA